MPIDPKAALGAELPPVDFSWDVSDVQLYHLGIGAGSRPTDPRDLRYLDDRNPLVLPSFATVAATIRDTAPPRVSFPGIEVDLAKVVHGSQSVTAHRPIPPAGKATATARIAEVWDKGKAAVIVTEKTTVDSDGALLWSERSSIFARGEGGFGGERGPSESVDLPDREPDIDVTTPISPQQALLYRMCGDRNPLHSSPEFAKAAGFPAPILHGLCSYGIVCRTAADEVLDGDGSRVTGFTARFSGIVFPGETLRTRIWQEDGRLLIRATVVERDDAPALSDVLMTYR